MKAVSPNTEAILLLTAPLLVGQKTESVKPLAPKEYRELANALMEVGREPADLLQDSALLGQIVQGVAVGRVEQLLNRGLQLSQALDMWSQRGIQVVSRADRQYPRMFKMRLKDKAPPLIYCCGNLDLFNRRGLAVVGSRKVDDHFELVDYADKVGVACATENITVVSGGAKGADKISMLGGLRKGGTAVGVLSCRMKSDVVSKDYKPALRDNRLLLCSAVDPSAGWNTGHAMQRNKYIYALADHALVIASETRGGTWAGALEQLDRFKFCPVLVNSSVLPASGNKKLIKHGAKPLSLDFSKPIKPQLADASLLETVGEQSELFSLEYSAPASASGLELQVKEAPAEVEYTTATPEKRIEQAVFPILHGLLKEPKTSVELHQTTGQRKGQIDDWMKKMSEQGLVRKLDKPVRYVAIQTGFKENA